MKIILDTNFLVYCARQKIDYREQIMGLIKEGYVLVTLSQVVDELKKLSEVGKKLRDRESARLALQLLEKNKVRVLKGRKNNADDSIIDISKGNIVATLDRVLRMKVGRIIVAGRGSQVRLV